MYNTSEGHTTDDNSYQYSKLIVQNYKNIQKNIHTMRDFFLKNFTKQIEDGKITHKQASDIFKEEVLAVINDITLQTQENKDLHGNLIKPINDIALQSSNHIINNMEDIDIDKLHRIELLRNINTDATSNTEEIQNRLYGCYHLEHLYINKHNEILNLFQFIILLHDKFQCTLKYLLYVLAVLNTHTCRHGGPVQHEHVPITVNLPKKVIGNISQLIKDQDTITDKVNKIKQQLDKAPLSTLTKENGDTLINPP